VVLLPELQLKLKLSADHGVGSVGTGQESRRKLKALHSPQAGFCKLLMLWLARSFLPLEGDDACKLLTLSFKSAAAAAALAAKDMSTTGVVIAAGDQRTTLDEKFSSSRSNKINVSFRFDFGNHVRRDVHARPSAGAEGLVCRCYGGGDDFR
jgi:hypothetical protein